MNARPLIPCVLFALAAGGCGPSPTARFYTLDATATADGHPPVPRAIVVGPVSIPPAVDRPQLVVVVAPNQVTVDEFNRWAAPLDDSIARAVAGDLATLLGASVAAAPAPGFTATHRVTLDVQRFDSVPGDAVTVDTLWTVRPAGGGGGRSGRSVAREPLAGKGVDTVAAAHSRALATVSADIAKAVRDLEPAPRRR
jgi:uncharacterized lipoprotein YmbA